VSEPALSMLVSAGPGMLMWLVVGVIAAVRWPRHPLVSALVVAAAGLEVLVSVARGALVFMVRENPGAMMTVSVASGVVGLAGTLCLVCAAFVDRQDPRQR
jgi:hypothetical protein